MNDMPENDRLEMERLQRMLDDATRANRTHAAPHDEPEVASLRDAWLAFGRLLDAAEEVQGESWNPDSIRRSELSRKQVSRRSRHFAAMAAAAAALVVALGLSWWLTRGVQPNGNRGPAAP